MAYVDGFVLTVPKKNLEAYREVAGKCGVIWREYGALSYMECVADDVKAGELTSFPQSTDTRVKCLVPNFSAQMCGVLTKQFAAYRSPGGEPWNTYFLGGGWRGIVQLFARAVISFAHGVV